MRSALITGITGQDGAYLARFLTNKGYAVYGTFRRSSTTNFWRLQYLKILDKVTMISADLTDAGSISNALSVSNPDEVYNLAAQSFVEASFDQPTATGDISGLSVTRILDALKMMKPDARFYQASSSEMFGNGAFDSQNEATPFKPASPYAAAKLYAYWITRIYREGSGVFAANGVLFNHESPIRGLEFVTRKVTNGAAMVKVGLAKKIHLGNIKAERDWGYAPEYVETMWKILQKDRPDDFVIATGKRHSVEELLECAFSVVGLNWNEHVTIDKKLFRPIDVPSLEGNSEKAHRELGWKPKTDFPTLVRLMVEADLQRWNDALEGKVFPWDVPLSIGMSDIPK
jgi:GDPmannose 4,6-dehydratase